MRANSSPEKHPVYDWLWFKCVRFNRTHLFIHTCIRTYVHTCIHTYVHSNCLRVWDFWLQLLVRFLHSQCCNTYVHTCDRCTCAENARTCEAGRLGPGSTANACRRGRNIWAGVFVVPCYRWIISSAYTVCLLSSASFLAEISVKSPWKLFIFIIKKNNFWIKVPKKK